MVDEPEFVYSKKFLKEIRSRSTRKLVNERVVNRFAYRVES